MPDHFPPGLACEAAYPGRALLDKLPFGILIVRGAGIGHCNAALRRLLGKDCIGLDLESLPVHPEDRDKIAYLVQRTGSGEAACQELEIRISPRDDTDDPADTIRWVRCQAVRLDDPDTILITLIDITRTKEMELLAATRARMASLGHVAAGIAHEIRNPLSGITLFLEALAAAVPEISEDPDLKQMHRHAVSGAAKIEAVIRRVIDFSKPSRPQLRRGPVAAPIAEAVGLSRVTLKKAGVRIETELAGGLPDLYLDVQLIEQVLLNLITNAAEAMLGSGGEKRIHIRTAAHEGGVTVAVTDTGPGIAPQVQARIFDPFYTTKREGMGIGLNLCQRIIADHGGTLRVSCPETGGTRFTIFLPFEKRSIPR